MSNYKDLDKQRETQRKYREKNREKINAYQRENYGAAYMRKWRDERPGQRKRDRETRKKYYYENQTEEQRKAREYMREYYKEHKDEQLASGRERYRKKRIQWNEFLTTQKCVHCGMSDPECLDFHHLDAKQKDNSVSAMLTHSWKRILAEIEKCIVLCANCHRKEHARLKREAN